MTAAPERIIVTRYRCPHCGTSRSKEAATAAHMDRCWKNPAVEGCKTCEHFIPGERLTSGPVDHDYYPESCTQGLLDNATKLATRCDGWSPELFRV